MAQINKTIYSDEHTLVISVFDDDHVKKANKSVVNYGLQGYYHYLFVSWNINERALSDQITRFAVKYKLNNIGLISMDPNGTFQLSRIIYDQLSVEKIPVLHKEGDCSIYEKMFHAKTKDTKGDDQYVYVMLDPPRGINLTHRNKDGQEVITMGGREAYLATLIPKKMNITMKLFRLLVSIDYFEQDKGTDEFFFLTEFLEKAYEEDNFTPKELDYEQQRLSTIDA